MNYNTGAYNKHVNYLSIYLGNYNLGKYDSGSSYNQQYLANHNAQDVDLFANQGTRYYREIQVKDSSGKPINLSGCTFTGQVQACYGTAKTLNLSILPVSLKTGVLGINIGASSTELLKKPRYVYHIDVNSNNSKTNIFRGQILITNR